MRCRESLHWLTSSQKFVLILVYTVVEIIVKFPLFVNNYTIGLKRKL